MKLDDAMSIHEKARALQIHPAALAALDAGTAAACAFVCLTAAHAFAGRRDAQLIEEKEVMLQRCAPRHVASTSFHEPEWA